MAVTLGVLSRPLLPIDTSSSSGKGSSPFLVRLEAIGEREGDPALELALELASDPAKELRDVFVADLVRVLVTRGEPLMGATAAPDRACPPFPDAPNGS